MNGTLFTVFALSLIALAQECRRGHIIRLPRNMI